MSHKIILNKSSSGSGLDAIQSEATYTFEYTPPHDQSAEQAAAQFAKVQKHLAKAVEAAEGAPTE